VEVRVSSEILATLDPDFSYEWSASDCRLVVASLASEDTEERRLAASLASALDPEEVAPELLRLFRTDPDTEVRAAAAIAVGPMLEESDTAIDEDDMPVEGALVDQWRSALRTVHDDPSEPDLVRRRALEAAVRAPDSWMGPAARRALTSTDPQWRMTGVFAAAHIAGLESLIVASLEDADPEVRIEAVRAAARGGVEEATSRLCEWARSRDTERELRHESIVALAHLPGTQSAEVLERLTGDRDKEVAELAQLSLEEHELWASVLGDEEE
jgi:HEAT repeat protein